MVADLEAYRKNYENLIELQNGTVAEYNELNEQIGETWFIVPGFRSKPYEFCKTKRKRDINVWVF